MVRFSLSEAIRKDISFSGLRLIPRPESGDILVPAYRGEEAKGKALTFLRLWGLWAIGMGLSPDLTKQILEKYFRITFHLTMYSDHATWDDFIDTYFITHRLSGAEEFKEWYREIVQKAGLLIIWFSYTELAMATDFFSAANWLGQGAEGVVFKARLHGHLGVMDAAVKHFKGMPGESLARVLGEVAIHREIDRDLLPDMVHLVGYCTCARAPLLVFQFMDNGNLRHQLEGVYGDYLLDHPRARLSIAIDLANALVQLHYKGRWPIFHRDVRSTNVLLNSDWRAKLTDLGLAVTIKNEADKRIAPVSYSRGYEDPVYAHTGVLDDKTDVYSFGVVVMELVTMMKVWDPQRRPERSLAELVVNRAKSGNPYTLIRYPGKVDNHSSDVLEKMMHVAVGCCHKDMEQRPTIDQVASDLQDFRSHGSRRKWVVGNHSERAPAPGCIGWKWELDPYPKPF
ncbi:hypothetical protein Mapa_001182 [Marchantia paleacea]|nr:hypothetical protein Mapa_001182 [Marchantia paleacea]